VKDSDPIAENEKAIDELIARYAIVYRKLEALSGQLFDLQRQIFDALAKQQQLRMAKKRKKRRDT
jgi:hypothetical protein